MSEILLSVVLEKLHMDGMTNVEILLESNPSCFSELVPLSDAEWSIFHSVIDGQAGSTSDSKSSSMSHPALFATSKFNCELGSSAQAILAKYFPGLLMTISLVDAKPLLRVKLSSIFACSWLVMQKDVTRCLWVEYVRISSYRTVLTFGLLPII